MNKVLRLKPVYLYWLISSCVVLVTGCASDDLPKRNFPQCTLPTAKIGSTAQLLDVNFALESTTGTIGTVIWDFGDGKQTATTAMTTQHTFSIPGTYKTSAKLTNACGDTVLVSKEITLDNTVPPSVTSQGVSDLNVTTATLRMAVDNKGNGKITRYGVCYSWTEGIPTITNSLTAGTIGDPAINSPASFPVDQLLPGTVYYFRGFATNNAGTGYGSVVSFTTSSPPALTTVGSSLVGVNAASVTFRVLNTGNPAATKYGICYSATTNAPTLNSPGSLAVSVDAPSLDANTILTLLNLQPNTTYSYRAFATSAIGTTYSPNTLSFTTQTDVDLTTGLIASYTFDGNGLDDSGNKNHGTLMNGAGYGLDRKGKVNAALQLDGINDYFDIPDAPSLRPGSISVSVWIKVSDLNRTMQIYNKSNFNDGSGEQYSSLIRPSLTGSGITINIDVKKNGACASGIGWKTLPFTSTPDLSTWHHLVSVFDGTIGKLYFDGANISNDNNTFPAGPIDNCAGGSMKFGAQYKGIENFFNGSIDDIRIYNRALTEAQIKALSNQ